MATTAEKKVWLAEAELARHNLLTGQQHASVTSEGFAATYSKQDIGRLEAYIEKLRTEIDTEEGTNQRISRKRLLAGF